MQDTLNARFRAPLPDYHQRTTRITFRLLGTGFERTVDYWLTVTDLEEGKELYRIPFKIDVVFGLDFGF